MHTDLFGHGTTDQPGDHTRPDPDAPVRHTLPDQPVPSLADRPPLRRAGTWLCLGIVVATTALTLTGRWYLATPAAVIGTGVTLERLVRHVARRDLLDALMLAAGGLLTVGVLTGLALNLTPAGLTHTSWCLALGAESVAALAFTLRLPERPSLITGSGIAVRRDALTIVTSLGAVAFVAFALLISATWSKERERADLQLSVRQNGGRQEVVVTAGRDMGPFDLVVESAGTRRHLDGPFVLDAGHSHIAPLQVRPGARTTVKLTDPGQRSAIRFVTVDQP